MTRISDGRDDALEFLNNKRPSGGTNILKGVKRGLELTTDQARSRSVYDPIIILLTDAKDNDHAFKTQAVQEMKKINTKSVPVFGVALGNDADFYHLKSIANNNFGFAKRIPIQYDAENLLENYFADLTRIYASLKAVNFTYTGVNSRVSSNNENSIQFGTAILTVGYYDKTTNKCAVGVKTAGKSSTGMYRTQNQNPNCMKSSPLIEKLGKRFFDKYFAHNEVLALLKMNEQLKKKKKRTDKKSLKKVLKLALEYSFVTQVMLYSY